MNYIEANPDIYVVLKVKWKRLCGKVLQLVLLPNVGPNPDYKNTKIQLLKNKSFLQ
jgi:hypothetical protein